MEDLTALHNSVACGRGVVWLVGDSTLDNKHWIAEESEPATNGYEAALDVALCVPDVSYWINHALLDRGLGGELCAINGAVEEATLGLHAGGALLPQEVFIRSQLCERDLLVASIGGNDVALRPTLATIASMLALTLSPSWLVQADVMGRGEAEGRGVRGEGSGLRAQG